MTHPERESPGGRSGQWTSLWTGHWIGAASGALLGLLASAFHTVSAQRYFAQGLHRLAAQTLLDWSVRGLFIGALAGLFAGAAAAAWRRELPARKGTGMLALSAGLLGALIGLLLVASFNALWRESRSEAALLALLGVVLAAGISMLLARRSPPRAPVLAKALGLALAAALVGAWLLHPRLRPSPSQPNLLLISVDTLRADRLGCYGHAAARTPNIDALAERGTLFEQVIASAPVTLTATATLFTGLDPTEHGAHYNGFYRLEPRLLTLAELLADRGYATAAVVGNFALASRFRISQGFAHFDDRMTQPVNEQPEPGRGAPRKRSRTDWWSRHLQSENAQRPADEVTDAALAWLARNGAERPFFLWVHYMDPHKPYTPPPEHRGGDPYDGEVAFVDAEIGRLLAGAPTGAAGQTLIAFVADHGESLGEHGYSGHVRELYEQTLRIPFLLCCDGRVEKGRRVESLLRGRDVAGTILGALGLQDHGFPAAAESLFAYSQTYQPRIADDREPLRCLRGERWKYVHQEGGREELYDLSSDPEERENVLADHPELARDLRARLQALFEGAVDAPQEIDSHMRERLIELGYIPDDRPGPDGRLESEK
jgi:arylsulfatase A-like enzyme